MSRRDQIVEEIRSALKKIEPTIEAGGLDSITLIVKLHRTSQSPRNVIARAEWGQD